MSATTETRSTPAAGWTSESGQPALPPRLLSIDDVAAYLGVSERWVYAQVRSGRLPAMLIARSWRLRLDVVERFAESFLVHPSGGDAT